MKILQFALRAPKPSTINGIDYYLPSNLDLDKLLKQYPPLLSSFCSNPQAVKDRLIVILSQLDKRVAFSKGLNLADNNGFVNLNAQLLQATSVKNYKQYIDWIIKVGIWECDGIYKPKIKSLGYKWKAPYNNCHSPRKHTIYDKSLFRKLSRISIDVVSGINHPDLLSDLQGIKVDMSKAITEQELHRLSMKKSWVNIKNDIKKRGSKSQYHRLGHSLLLSIIREHASRKVYATNKVVNEIIDGNLYFKQDSTSRRLHTNITSLKSEMRGILKHQGNDLVSLDIKNSQPFMSLALLSSSPSTEIKSIIDTNIQYLQTFDPAAYKNTQQILANIRSGRPPLDVVDYTDKVTTGTLYDYLMTEWNKQLGTSYNRAQAKEQLFKIFFQPPSFNSKQKTLFASLFPTIWKLISHINKGFTTTKNNRKANKTYLGNSWAIILQNIESHLVLDVICPNIKGIRRSIPLLTIHDSIATTLINESTVLKIMKQVLLKEVGHSPTIKSEMW